MISKLSIIISTYNQPEYLNLILASLSKQVNIDYSRCEVVIADDGSVQDTANLIASFQIDYPCKLKHIWHEDIGFRKSIILNKAVIASGGDYLIFIDGDCVVGKDFIYQQIKMAELGFFVAGNRVLLSQSYTEQIIKENINLQALTWLQWVYLFFTKKTNKLLHWIRMPHSSSFRKLRSSDWKYPKGCNVSLWRSDYFAVNGYDESFTGWGHEDADFFIRLLHSGIKIKDGRFAAPVYHLWHKLSSRDNEKKNMQKLMDIVNNPQLIVAKNGVNQYL